MFVFVVSCGAAKSCSRLTSSEIVTVRRAGDNNSFLNHVVEKMRYAGVAFIYHDIEEICHQVQRMCGSSGYGGCNVLPLDKLPIISMIDYGSLHSGRGTALAAEAKLCCKIAWQAHGCERAFRVRVHLLPLQRDGERHIRRMVSWHARGPVSPVLSNPNLSDESQTATIAVNSPTVLTRAHSASVIDDIHAFFRTI